MELLITIIAIYLIVINLDAFLLMRSDKRRAQQGRRRIPEATLFLVAVLGGSPGVMLAMRRYRHKTLHSSFTVGMPLICFFECSLLAAGLIIAYIGV